MSFRWSIETKLILSLVYAFYFVLAGAIGSYQSSRTVIDTSRHVANSLSFTGSVQSILPLAKSLDEIASKEAPKGSEAIERWERTAGEANAALQKVNDTYRDDTRRSGYLKTISERLILLIDVDRRLCKSAPASKEAASLRQQSASLVDKLHGAIETLETEEGNLLKAQIAEYQADADNVLMRHYLFSLLVLVFLVSLGITLVHYVRVMRRAMSAERRIAQGIVEHAPIGILKLDRQDIVSEVNPIFCSYVGLKAHDVIGKKVVDLLPGLPAEIIREAADEQEARQLEDLVVVVDKGEPDLERHWDVTLWPVLDDTDTVKGMILLIVDVTEKVSLSNQREVFAQTLTHDMKTPLIAADRIYEAMLCERVGKLDSAHIDLLGKLRRNNHDVLKMVKDVLEVSKYRDKTPLLNPEPIDLNGLIQDCVEKMQSVGEARHVALRKDLPAGDLVATADKTAIKHLVLNLLENAIKFSPSGETVEVSARQVDQSVLISVTDRGGGISKEDQTKLFKASWQGDLGKTAPSGTGLGLYLCHQIVRAHRGEISVESELEAGTTFVVKLPCALRPAGSMSAGATESTAASDAGQKRPAKAAPKESRSALRAEPKTGAGEETAAAAEIVPSSGGTPGQDEQTSDLQSESTQIKQKSEENESLPEDVVAKLEATPPV